jgi:hypothetical protein
MCSVQTANLTISELSFGKKGSKAKDQEARDRELL